MHRLHSTKCSKRLEHTFQPQHLPSTLRRCEIVARFSTHPTELGFLLGWKWQSFSTFIIISFKSGSEAASGWARSRQTNRLTDCMSVCLSVCLFVCLSVCLSAWLATFNAHTLLAPTHTHSHMFETFLQHISLTETHIHTQKKRRRRRRNRK